MSDCDQTPVPLLSVEAERAHLGDLLARRYNRVLAMSDLHLYTGQDPATQTYPFRENFLADDAFARCLGHFFKEDGPNTLLVLNGDVFDFIRIERCPTTKSDFAAWRARLDLLGAPSGGLEERISRSERRFGLRTDADNTVWRLLLVAHGHAHFFGALALWVHNGGSLVISSGNHDLELYWPLVRQAIRDELVLRGADPHAVVERIAFAHEPFIVDNVYVEHGHQYEEMTRVDGEPVLGEDPAQINLPLGSFVNRYFINKIEHLNPFIDNIKPVNAALLALLRREPLEMIRAYFRGYKFLGKAIADRRLNWSVFTIFLGLIVPPLTLVGAIVFYGINPTELRPVRAIVTALSGSAFTLLLPYLIGIAGGIAKAFGFRPKDHLKEGAVGALAKAFPNAQPGQLLYAVMAHTHAHGAVRIGASGERRFYVNTGTWTGKWDANRPDLSGQILYNLVYFTREPDGLHHNLLEWDDRAEAPRPARILAAPSKGSPFDQPLLAPAVAPEVTLSASGTRG